MLNKTVTHTLPNNVELNRNLWDNYARTWDTDKPWIKQMISDVSQQAKADSSCLILGEEWSDDTSFIQVFDEFISPYLQSSKGRVLEIGVGGGRVARKVAPILPPGTLTCLDISTEMLKHARRNLQEIEHLNI